MSRREYTHEENTLYLKFVEGFDAKASLVSAECDGGDGYVNVQFNDELLERYKPYGTEEELKAVLTDLSSLLGECECAEIGTVEVNGWYEAPTICWSDPSCSDPGDGDSTATADLVSADGIYEAIKATLENAVIEVFEANNNANEKYNREQPQSIEYMLEKYLEGVEYEGNINVSVYARVIQEIPWLCNDIIKLDGEEI
jgi:hypothetical protein